MKAHQWFIFVVVVLLVSMLMQPLAVFAQSPETDTPTPTGDAPSTLTPSPTSPPAATLTPEPSPTLQAETATPVASSDRPIVVVASYSVNKSAISVGKSFNISIKVTNQGRAKANNVVFTFDSTKFFPQGNGGIITIGDLESGNEKEFSQDLIPSSELWGQNLASMPVRINYTDPNGTAFTDTFNLTLAMTGGYTTGATATATVSPRARMVITHYETDVNPLQPGAIFNLKMTFSNQGTGKAQSVTMVLGGAGSTPDENQHGTQVPSGVTGGSGDLANFAPLGSSNISYIGDVDSGASKEFTQKLIVNVSTNPGAYSLKVSFVYSDGTNKLVDDQIITLLVYTLPTVEVNFYRDPGPLMVGQPNLLPVQVVNLGRKSTILGNLTISTQDGEITNNTGLIGTLDAGGYFTLDASFVPSHSGSIDLEVTIHYNDDFNQPQTISQKIKVQVQDAPPQEAFPKDGPQGPGSMNGEEANNPDGSGQILLRLFKGLIGLDSAPPQNASGPMGAPENVIEAVPSGN